MKNLNKDYDELKRKCAGAYDIILPPEVLDFIRQREKELLDKVNKKIGEVKRGECGLHKEYEFTTCDTCLVNYEVDNVLNNLKENLLKELSNE